MAKRYLSKEVEQEEWSNKLNKKNRAIGQAKRREQHVKQKEWSSSNMRRGTTS
jgi:hypothetical protein